MSTTRIFWLSVAGLVSLQVLAGCGRGDQPAVEARGSGTAARADSADRSAGRLPTLSVRHNGGPQQHAPDLSGPPEGSPEWLVRRMKDLRARPFPQNDDVSLLAAVRRDRNQRIVRMATEAIAEAHDDPEKEETFLEAVRQLMEARLQLALQGDPDDIDALFDDAAALREQAPESPAAAEAAWTTARFTHANALRTAPQETRWLEAWARQARLFAADFPDEQVRALPMLYAAAWSCDLHQMTDEAIGCYALIEQLFPDSDQARQATAALRRLQLPGRPLRLAGPTRDGRFVSIDELQGKVVLVVFWASDSQRFVDRLPQLEAIARRYERHGLAVLGVSLDEDEAALDAFLEEHVVPGVQIFHPEPDSRRWNNPIVRHYGIREIPMLWLVDHNGIVIDTHADPSRLLDVEGFAVTAACVLDDACEMAVRAIGETARLPPQGGCKRSGSGKSQERDCNGRTHGLVPHRVGTEPRDTRDRNYPGDRGHAAADQRSRDGARCSGIFGHVDLRFADLTICSYRPIHATA
jgi:peroxiredoxin